MKTIAGVALTQKFQTDAWRPVDGFPGLFQGPQGVTIDLQTAQVNSYNPLVTTGSLDT